MFRPSVFVPIADRVYTASGSGEKPSFKMEIDKDGRRSLRRDGVIDVYAQIQSHKDSVDIHYIMERFANGDASVLSKAQGIYGDFTNVPTSVVELQQRVMDAERLFYTLPVDVREKFEHNPSMFYASIGSDAFNEVMGIDKTKDNPATVDKPVTPGNVSTSEVTNNDAESK